MDQIKRLQIVNKARTRLGDLYKLGAKWNVHDSNPQGPIDCSGFTRWCYFQGSGILIPDGSYFQYGASVPCSRPDIADLGFLKSDTGQIDHVGLVLDDEHMIEAHGHTILGNEPPMQVVIRKRKDWEALSHFAGYRTLK